MMLPVALIPALLLLATLQATEVSTAQGEAYSALVGLGFELNSEFTLADAIGYEPPRIPGARYLTSDEFMSELGTGNTRSEDIYIVTAPGSAEKDSQPANMARELVWTMGDQWLPADFYQRDPSSWSELDGVYFSDAFALIDFERIENPGDYVSLLERMVRLGGGVASVANVRDHLPPFWLWQFGLGGASVDFDFNGAPVHWSLEVEQDWVDPHFFVRFDELIEQSGSNEALYSFNDGQSDLFFIADATTASELARLVDQPLREWRSYRGEIQ
jgi:hypothetical protein